MPTNYLFPFPLWFHVIFCVLGVGIFLIQYARKRYAYQLLLSFGIASTLLVYFCNTNLTFLLLGLEEFILLTVIIVLLIRAKKIEEKKQKSAKKTENQNENCNS